MHRVAEIFCLLGISYIHIMMLINCSVYLAANHVTGLRLTKLKRGDSEVIVAYFELLSRYSIGETEDSHEKPQDGLCPGQASNRASLCSSVKRCNKLDTTFRHYTARERQALLR